MKHYHHIFICITIIFATIFLSSCNDGAISGNGILAYHYQELDTFHSVNINGMFEVLIKQGDSYKLEIETDSNLIRTISGKVENQELKVSQSKIILKSEKLKLIITSPYVDNLEIQGAVEIKSDSLLSWPRTNLNVTGAANVSLSIDGQEFIAYISGGSKIKLNGNVQHFELTLTGAGQINAEDFNVKTCNVNISGIGKANLNTSDSLHVAISGAGKVTSRGGAFLSQSITGAGKVELIK